MSLRKMMLTTYLLLSTGRAENLSETLPCTAQAIPKPEYFGTFVTNLQAKEVRGWNVYTSVRHWSSYAPFGILETTPPSEAIDFCNVTVTYTHPGLDDEVNVYVWLPLEGWNQRFIGVGGLGFAARTEGALGSAVQAGYAAVDTDGGHTMASEPLQAVIDASWGLASPGVVDWPSIQNFASIALNDMSHLGKAITSAFYSKPPKYSYWNGCSTGGRQGIMQAQRFPKNFDGILAMAPGINWDSFLIGGLWGYVVMKREGYYPPECELAAIQEKAIEACDELDGVRDGVVAAQGLCDFVALTVVGQTFDCEGEVRNISAEAARIANAVWAGPTHPTRRGWYGLAHEAPMALSEGFSLVKTNCDSANRNCSPIPFPIAESWLKYFVKKDPNFDIDEMTEEQFWGYLHITRQWYESIIETDDPDLEEFHEAGGKMIAWHGLADQVVSPNGSANYFDRVLELDPNARKFFRYFEAPGVEHCMGGPGAVPDKAFQALIDWVEKGKAPEILEAATVSNNLNETIKRRPLCQYPKVAAYVGGDPDEASSFECADSFGTKVAREEWGIHREL